MKIRGDITIMIHTLDTKAADYIPELGDGFEERGKRKRTGIAGS